MTNEENLELIAQARENEVSVQAYKTTDQFIEEFKSFDDAKIKQLSVARSEAWSVAWSAARSEAWSVARDADLAVLVKDKITAEELKILISTWTSCGSSLFRKQ